MSEEGVSLYPVKASPWGVGNDGSLNPFDAQPAHDCPCNLFAYHFIHDLRMGRIAPTRSGD